MKRFLPLVLLVGTFTPAMALPVPVVPAYRAGNLQGHVVAVRGRAQVYTDATLPGTNVNLVASDGRIIFVGFIPKLNEGAFPDVASLNGREVEMYGVVEFFRGHPATQLTVSDQLRARVP